jgi:large subunit ribosomal protein L24
MAKNSKRLQHNSVGEKEMQATKPVKDPRKQRKMLYNAPAHVRHRFMGAHLSQELAASKGAKTLPVRKGDTVRIMRGDNAGFEGKVSRVDLKNYRIYIEGLTREKVDGTNIFVSVHPSKVMIRSLNLDDKWRKAIVERKQELELPKKEEKVEKAAEVEEAKPVKKPKIAAAAEEKLPEKKPIAKPKAAPKKPVAKKKEEAPATEEKPAARKRREKAPAAEEKPAARKRKKEPPEAEEKPAAKKTKPKTVKKTPTKRKTAASKKEGGT